jgi:probable phosphoglycerate mutase
VLWRHGRTAWNRIDRFQGQLDTPLDEVGRQQAENAAALLVALGPDRLVASDLERARDTAAYLAEATGIDVTYDERLREVFLGGWQGRTRPEVAAEYPDELTAWLAGEDARRGGGETMVEVGERAAAAVRAHLDGMPEGATLVAVTHGGTARACIGTLLGLDVAVWSQLGPLGNCCWSVLAEGRLSAPEGASRWRLLEHNAGTLPTPVERGGDDAR